MTGCSSSGELHGELAAGWLAAESVARGRFQKGAGGELCYVVVDFSSTSIGNLFQKEILL